MYDHYRYQLQSPLRAHRLAPLTSLVSPVLFYAFHMHLAHAADDRLVRFRVGVHPERGIFLGQLRQRDPQLVLVGLGLRLDRDRDDGIREAHRLENDWMRLVAQRVAGARVLEADGGGSVAGTHVLDLFAVVGMHLQQPADTLPTVFGAV